MQLRTHALVLCLVSALASIGQAQRMAPHHRVEHRTHSGLHDGDGMTLRKAYEEVVTIPGAAWLQLEFADVELGGESFVIMWSLEDGADWMARVRGIRSNASRLSHAELDEAETLDDGDPDEFGRLHRALHDRFRHLSIIGGCCGTDHRHVSAASAAIA